MQEKENTSSLVSFCQYKKINDSHKRKLVIVIVYCKNRLNNLINNIY